ncbi:hypothetical protein CaCOL14_002703 [Colletotrichum acutatum]
MTGIYDQGKLSSELLGFDQLEYSSSSCGDLYLHLSDTLRNMTLNMSILQLLQISPTVRAEAAFLMSSVQD